MVANEIVLYKSGEQFQLEVQLKDDTVWLTQEQIATLFGTKRPAITKHLSNIYQSGELDEHSTCSILEHMGNDGKQRYFEMLDVRQSGVTADIYSSGTHATLRDVHNVTTGTQPVKTHVWRNPSHDRWLIIDDQLYHCGHSFKDVGHKISAIMLMGEDPKTILQKMK